MGLWLAGSDKTRYRCGTHGPEAGGQRYKSAIRKERRAMLRHSSLSFLSFRQRPFPCSSGSPALLFCFLSHFLSYFALAGSAEDSVSTRCFADPEASSDLAVRTVIQNAMVMANVSRMRNKSIFQLLLFCVFFKSRIHFDSSGIPVGEKCHFSQ